MKVELLENQIPAKSYESSKTTAYSHNSHDTAARIAEMTAGYSLDISGRVKDNNAYGDDDLKSVEDVMMGACANDVQLNRNYMAVMSNSLSDEDFAELIKEGGRPGNMKFDEIVTSMDKIKATLAENGTIIRGFNDDMSSEEIKRIVGDSPIAGDIEKALKSNDLPLSEDNVSGMADAYDKISKIDEVSEDMLKYMVRTGMEPTIENLYKAEYSSRFDSARQSQGYFKEDMGPYYAKKAEMGDFDKLEPQIRRIIEATGAEGEKTAVDDAKWMVEMGLPLREDSFSLLNRIKGADINPDNEKLFGAMASAISDGKSASDGNLYDSRSIADKICELTDSLDELINTRKMHEARLHMSLEAGSRLAAKGFDINAKEMSELVDELKRAEREYYRPFLSDESDYAGKGSDERDNTVNDGKKWDVLDYRIGLFKNTVNVLNELKSLPADAMAAAVEDEPLTLETIHEKGLNLKDTYEKAGKAYEGLMTEVRPDLGDSIKKAFGNSDELLREIGEEANDDNRKAVRILGYSGTEINKDNLYKVLDAWKCLNGIMDKMTPMKTLSMIREGHNPLSDNIYELSERLSEGDPLEKAYKYSEYLVKLEKRGTISEEERESYIGMYRLFNELSRSDSRVIGDVIKAGRELTLNNLLSASRSNRARGMDVSVDDGFGLLTELNEKTRAIDTQIGTAFSGAGGESGSRNPSGSDYDRNHEEQYYKSLADEISNRMTPDNIGAAVGDNTVDIVEMAQMVGTSTYELTREIINEAREDIKKASGVADTVIENLLENATDIGITIDNILAEDSLRSYRDNAFRQLMKDGTDVRNRFEERLTKAFNKMSDSLTGSSEAEDAYNEMIGECKRAVEDSIYSANTHIDVREQMLIHKQLTFAAAKSRNEEYEIPVKIADEWTSLHLKIVRDSEESGRVAIGMESEKYGKVEARFLVAGDEVSGYTVSDDAIKAGILEDTDEMFAAKLKELGLQSKGISYLSGNGNIKDIKDNGRNKEDQASLKQLYSVAKAFIDTVSERI